MYGVGDSAHIVHKALIIPACIMVPHRLGSQDRADGVD
jgi:hypothetical protein